MRTKYKVVDEDYPYFITSTIVEWMPVFTKDFYCNIITESLDHCIKNKNLILHAYVIMDNHVHLLATGENLPKIIQDFKSFTARKIIDRLKEESVDWLLTELAFYKKKHKADSQYQLWQEGYHPQIINTDKVLHQKIDYIHNNPVKRGLVKNQEDWIYSSASNYLNGKGVLDIEIIE